MARFVVIPHIGFESPFRSLDMDIPFAFNVSSNINQGNIQFRLNLYMNPTAEKNRGGQPPPAVILSPLRPLGPFPAES